MNYTRFAGKGDLGLPALKNGNGAAAHKCIQLAAFLCKSATAYRE